MEKRIFRFGKSSSAIILPKRWIEKNKVDIEKVLSVKENENGGLVISPSSVTKNDYVISINSELEPDILSRWIGKLYIYGLGKVRVSSKDGITAAQIREIEEEIKEECPGFEITQQSYKEMVIEDFTDIKEISIERVTSRIRYLISQQFEEAKKGNAKTVIKIEKLVDRFERMGKRYLYIIEPKDTLKHFIILSNLNEVSNGLLAYSENLKTDKGFLDSLSKAFEICFNNDRESLKKSFLLRKRLLNSAKKKNEKMAFFLVKKISNKISSISEFVLMNENKEPDVSKWNKIK